MDDQYIAFGYWKDNTFQGWRADTFNTISMDHAKVYTYSKDQVNVVIMNVTQSCNKVGTSFAKILANKNLVSNEGHSVDGSELVQHVTKTEETFQEWGEFEVRVHPFMNRDEFYSLGEGDEWKKKEILNNPQTAIEVHKFKIVENPN